MDDISQGVLLAMAVGFYQIDSMLFVRDGTCCWFSVFEVFTAQGTRQECRKCSNNGPGQHIPPVVSIVDDSGQRAEHCPRGQQHLAQRKGHAGSQLWSTTLQIPDHEDRSVHADGRVTGGERLAGVTDEVRPLDGVGARVLGDVLVSFANYVRSTRVQEMWPMFTGKDL